MKKRLLTVLSLLLCVALLLCACSSSPSGSSSDNPSNNQKDPEKEIDENIENLIEARISVWDGSVADSFSSGTGAPDDPYIIASAAELAYVGKRCAEGHNFTDEFLVLDCNINLNGLEWDPIAKYSSTIAYGPGLIDDPRYEGFQGHFDGNGYFVSNYVINENLTEDDKYVCFGLFGCVKFGTVENLTVKDFKITVTGNSCSVGGLAGECVGTSSFRNCHVIGGSITTYVVYNHIFSGGLIGVVRTDSHEGYDKCATIISECSANTNLSVSCLINRKTVYISQEDGDKYYTDLVAYSVGGLVGAHYGTQSITTNCFSDGSIYVSTSNKKEEEDALSVHCSIGGLMAYTNSALVENCYSSVNIISEQDVSLEGFGGLIGFVEDGTVYKCYSSGTLTVNYSNHHTPCGGLVGIAERSSIMDCFTTGQFSWHNKNNYGKFLVGYAELKDEDTIENCYVSSACKIKEMAPTSEPYEDDKYYTIVEADRLTSKEFLMNKLGFEERPANVGPDLDAALHYAGWILSDGSLPKMHYEETVKENANVAPNEDTPEVNERIASFIGKKAEDAIAKFGTDYTMYGMSLFFSNVQVSFALGTYSGTLLGTEEIVAINIGGERDLGDGLNSSMTYNALKDAVKADIPFPSYLEIDGKYIVSVDVGKYVYVYTWSTEDYDTEKCDFVTITQKS